MVLKSKNFVDGPRPTSVHLPGRCAGLFGFTLLLPFSAPLMAQALAPSQVIPRDITPPAHPPTTVANPVHEEPTTRPAGRDLTFTTGQVRIDGSFEAMARANEEIRARTSNRRLTIDDLFAAARDLESAYARAGYILARVTVPSQRFADGDGVRLLVTDGTIGAIDTDNVPQAVLPAVLARVHALVGVSQLTLARIERQLLLLNAIPGLKLRSALAPGKEAGTVRLVLEGVLERVSSRLAADNRLPAALGTWQLSGNTALNNILGRGEQIYFTAGSQITQDGVATAHNPLMTFGGGVSLLVGRQGLNVAAEYLYSRTSPRPLPGAPGAAGVFSRVEVRAAYPLILRRPETLTVSGAVDLVGQSLHLTDFGLDLSKDRYAAARVGLTWQRWFGGTPLSAQVQFSQGIAGRSSTSGLPASRQGALPSFRRLDGTVGTTLALPASFSLNVTLRGQTGFGASQFVSEQFALDASDGVSVFTSGSFSVDSGASLRSELRLPVVAPDGHLRLAPYLFAAGGRGSLARPTAVEQATRSAAGLGGGARMSLDAGQAPGGKTANLAVEFGQQFSNAPDVRRGSRASLALSFGY